MNFKYAKVIILVMDSIPSVKNIPQARADSASSAVKTVPKARKQVAPAAIAIKPVKIIRPKIIKPVIKIK
jgi:hypothetical protein